MSKVKPDLKAWQVNPINLDYGHESIARGFVYESFLAKDEKEARKKALRFLDRDCGIENDFCNEPLTYITVKVKRYPEDDRFLVDGDLKSKEQIEYGRKKKENEDAFNKLLAENPDGYAYIAKGGYYYGPNCGGYTEHRFQAGVYPLKKAVQECLGCDLRDYMRPILINVDEHNASIKKHIERLKTGLILTEGNNDG